MKKNQTDPEEVKFNLISSHSKLTLIELMGLRPFQVHQSISRRGKTGPAQLELGRLEPDKLDSKQLNCNQTLST